MSTDPSAEPERFDAALYHGMVSFDPAWLFLSMVPSGIGFVLFVYGKKQTKFVPMLAGVMLCVYPYFFESLLWLCVVGGVLLAAPFLIDF